MNTPILSRSLALQLLVTTPIRVLLNTAYRMVYPFLPEFSRGLGVAPEALTQLLAARSGFGLAGPLFGLVPDKFGRRFAMVAGLIVFTATFALAALRPSFATVAIAVFGALIAKSLHDPALLAHFGDHTPPRQRGLVVGVSEFGWAGATFIGVPVLGLLIARYGWSAPFAPLAVLGLLAAFGLHRVIASAQRTASTRATPFTRDPASRKWQLRAFLNPHTLTILSYGGVVSLGNEMLNVVYGSWMESSFNLPVDQLALTVGVIGAAELAGEGLVAAFADRLGKRQMVAVATAIAAVAYAALPFLSVNLWLALAGIFLVFLGFETGIVANIPLLIDLLPDARSTVVSASGALHSIGRMTGALLGAWLFGLGFVWVGAAAAMMTLVMAALVWWHVREHAPVVTNEHPISE